MRSEASIGDGYQNPDTSNSGIATAVASYDRIDFSIGSDSEFFHDVLQCLQDEVSRIADL